jgi:hypothetical protein
MSSSPASAAKSVGFLCGLGKALRILFWLAMLLVVARMSVHAAFFAPTYDLPQANRNGSINLQGYGWPWVYQGEVNHPRPAEAEASLRRAGFITSYHNNLHLLLNMAVVGWMIFATGASFYRLTFHQFRFRLSSLLLVMFAVAATWTWGITLLVKNVDTAIFRDSVAFALLWAIGCSMFYSARIAFDILTFPKKSIVMQERLI